MTLKKKPVSANGYVLEYNGGFLKATWKAPYFVLAPEGVTEGDEPALIHCDDLAHALLVRARHAGAIVYDEAFVEVPR